MKISHGETEDGIVVGNAFDKYGSVNPLVRRLMGGFEASLEELLQMVKPSTVHEVGCGEGFWVMRWNEANIAARGSDFSAKVIALAKQNAGQRGCTDNLFRVRSIYELDPVEDVADLIVCCEVLEHLSDPRAALLRLQQMKRSHLIFSVPREPLWRILNMVRMKYLSAWGNTPGHIQHWSKVGFVNFISEYFHVLSVRTPLPWTMVLCRPRERPISK
jgi:2-polyprenyl-3-methyl-5-hydroxy-6-metoxy-1,4-benzoquinol methylase